MRDYEATSDERGDKNDRGEEQSLEHRINQYDLRRIPIELAR